MLSELEIARLAVTRRYPVSLEIPSPARGLPGNPGVSDATRLPEQDRKLLRLLGHELASPLTLILGYVRLWQEQGTITRKEDLDLVAEQAATLRERLEDIMLLHQFQAGTVPLQREPLIVQELVGRVVGDFASRIAARQLTPVVFARGKEPVLADAGLIKRALGCLLSNACEFSPPGGLVSVSAREENGSCVIAVTDEGEGISPELHDRIFEPFFQTDQTRARHHNGLGVGLTLVRAIVERHGGRVCVASQPGRGSTFTIILPLW